MRAWHDTHIISSLSTRLFYQSIYSHTRFVLFHSIHAFRIACSFLIAFLRDRIRILVESGITWGHLYTLTLYLLPFTLSQVKVLPFSPGIFIPYTFIYTIYPYPKVKFHCDLHPWNTYLVGVLLSVLYFIISMSSIWWASVLHGVRRIFMAASHKLHKYCYELRK